MLEPQSSVDYVVNDSSQASQQAAETQAKTGDEGKYYVGSNRCNLLTEQLHRPSLPDQQRADSDPLKAEGSQ